MCFYITMWYIKININWYCGCRNECTGHGLWSSNSCIQFYFKITKEVWSPSRFYTVYIKVNRRCFISAFDSDDSMWIEFAHFEIETLNSPLYYVKPYQSRNQVFNKNTKHSWITRLWTEKQVPGVNKIQKSISSADLNEFIWKEKNFYLTGF